MLKVNVLESLKKSVAAKTYSTKYSPMASRYLRSKGIVLEPLRPGSIGRIKLDGVLWKARLSETPISTLLPRGTRVLILYRDGLTLVVEPSMD